jgi:hypothetical protein
MTEKFRDNSGMDFGSGYGSIGKHDDSSSGIGPDFKMDLENENFLED